MVDPVSAGAAAKALTKAVSTEPEIPAEAAKLLDQVSGGARREMGAMLGDRIRARRLRTQIKLLEKTREYLRDAGHEPREVKWNVLFPLLEAASLEEDQEMADRWAALLANAADPDAATVSPAFPGVLARLSPRDAQALQAVHTALTEQTGEAVGVVGVYARQIADHHGWPLEEVEFSFETLQILGLCAQASPATVGTDEGPRGLLGSDRTYVVETPFGRRFLAACQPPQVKG